MTIIQKINAIAAELQKLQTRTRPDNTKSEYVPTETLVARANELFRQHNILCVPRELSRTAENVTYEKERNGTMYQNSMFVVNVTIEFELITDDKSSVKAVVSAIGKSDIANPQDANQIAYRLAHRLLFSIVFNFTKGNNVNAVGAAATPPAPVKPIQQPPAKQTTPPAAVIPEKPKKHITPGELIESLLKRGTYKLVENFETLSLYLVEKHNEFTPEEKKSFKDTLESAADSTGMKDLLYILRLSFVYCGAVKKENVKSKLKELAYDPAPTWYVGLFTDVAMKVLSKNGEMLAVNDYPSLYFGDLPF